MKKFWNWIFEVRKCLPFDIEDSSSVQKYEKTWEPSGNGLSRIILSKSISFQLSNAVSIIIPRPKFMENDYFEMLDCLKTLSEKIFNSMQNKAENNKICWFSQIHEIFFKDCNFQEILKQSFSMNFGRGIMIDTAFEAENLYFLIK